MNNHNPKGFCICADCSTRKNNLALAKGTLGFIGRHFKATGEISVVYVRAMEKRYLRGVA